MQFFINSTIGSNGALTLRSRFQPRYQGMVVSAKTPAGAGPRRTYFEGITDVGEIMRVSRQFSNVIACSPVLRGSISARAGFEGTTAEVFGIDPISHLRATDLANQIVDGTLDDFRNNTEQRNCRLSVGRFAAGRRRRLNPVAFARGRILAVYRGGDFAQWRCRNRFNHAFMCNNASPSVCSRSHTRLR